MILVPKPTFYYPLPISFHYLLTGIDFLHFVARNTGFVTSVVHSVHIT